MHAAEKDFIIATVASACVYSGFSLIAYWLVGPIGVIAELTVFQHWFFRNLDQMIFRMRLA